jgi:hypothetical protein
MAFELTWQRAASLAALLLVTTGLAGCTTTEGTNAFTSVATFEHEVLDPTAQGIGLIPKSVKPDPTNNRGPLVMPKDTAVLPPPSTDTTLVADIPADSDKPKVDTQGLSSADIEKLKHVRVVDLNTPDGRPLSAAELKTLTGKMRAFSLNQKRSIFVPPEQYYTVSAGQQNLVCLSTHGDLVPVSDPNCPDSIKKALLKKS